MLALRFWLGFVGNPLPTAVLFILLLFASRALGQSAAVSPDRPWHASDERKIEADAKNLRDSGFNVDPAKTYSLAELIDLAEAHNPVTRLAWERARSQAAALGVARSELFPTLAAAVLSETSRFDVLFGNEFFRQNIQDFEVALDLNYTIFDFGARSGRINAARAQVLAVNFAFNDTHRTVIHQVEQAYYRLLNSMGQEDAARASLSNAQAVEQAAEDRLKNGLATLPDVLEARSATAQAEYDLQAVLGAKQIAQGDLLTALGAPAHTPIRVQSLSEAPTPESASETIEEAIQRALAQRPDLQAQAAEIRVAQAERQQARAAFYPSLNVAASPSAQSLYLRQQTLPWGHTAGFTGAVAFSLNWTVFDGGSRRSRLAQAEDRVREAQGRLAATHDRIEDQVLTAYTNLKTAFSQREAATALLTAATQSYGAALQSYNYGVRNLLDVTNAQKVLAQGRSTDILARTQVLAALADLVFRTGDAIQINPTLRRPSTFGLPLTLALCTGCSRAPSFEILGSFF